MFNVIPSTSMSFNELHANFLIRRDAVWRGYADVAGASDLRTGRGEEFNNIGLRTSDAYPQRSESSCESIRDSAHPQLGRLGQVPCGALLALL